MKLHIHGGLRGAACYGLDTEISLEEALVDGYRVWIDPDGWYVGDPTARCRWSRWKALPAPEPAEIEPSNRAGHPPRRCDRVPLHVSRTEGGLMATLPRLTDGQRRTQERIIRDLFGVDPMDVREEFEVEFANPDTAMLSIRLVKFIDRSTAEALLIPIETPEQGTTSDTPEGPRL